MPTATTAGGVHIAWLLADEPRTVTTKNGERTVMELRDPRRLSQSLVLWLDGPAGALAEVPPGQLVQLQLESVRGGRSRGELVGNVRRESVEAAIARVQGASA